MFVVGVDVEEGLWFRRDFGVWGVSGGVLGLSIY